MADRAGHGVDLLAAGVAEDPDLPALDDGDRVWSRRELDRAVAALAATMPGGSAASDESGSSDQSDQSDATDATDASGAPGARTGAARPSVAVLLHPSADAVVALHAVLRSGALLAPLNPGLTPGEMADAFRTIRPSLVLVSRDTAEAARAAARASSARAAAERAALERTAADGATVDGARTEWATMEGAASTADAALEVRVVDGLLDLGAERAGEAAASVGRGGPSARHRDPDAPAAVLWTSGTSGAPRGVLLTAGGLRHSARASARRLGLGPDDRWYASLSPAHVGGLALVTRAAILGSRLTATGPFDAGTLSALIDEGRVTHASLVPTMLGRLLDHRGDAPTPASLRCLLVGGAACPPPLLERARDAGLPVALTWGMTETTSQAATAPPELVGRKPGTAGPPLDGVEIRVVDGELRVRGPVVSPARLVAPGRTPPVADDDGWLATGDLGRLDDDGHVWVTGRRSDRIITGGVNVDPAEVEAVLVAHEGVAEAAVVGMPDPEWGERVVAAVVPAGADDADPAAPQGALQESLRAWVRDRLAPAKRPKKIAVLEALPRNANGKVDREEVRSAVGRSYRPRSEGP